MPVYEYYCSACHAKFDALRTMSEADAPINCEHCASKKTARVLSVVFAHSGGSSMESTSGGSGCACGGACSCGHSHN